MSNYTDILYEVKGGVARISINRPESTTRSAARPATS